MEIKNYKSIGKGCLVGKFDIEIKEWGGLTICECTVFQKDAKRWICLPGRQFQSQEGQKKHLSLIKFNSDVFKKLEASALAQLDVLMVPQSTFQETTGTSLPF